MSDAFEKWISTRTYSGNGREWARLGWDARGDHDKATRERMDALINEAITMLEDGAYTRAVVAKLKQAMKGDSHV